MKNWILIDDHWINFDYFRELWIEKDNSYNQYYIMVSSSIHAHKDKHGLFNIVFTTRIDAQKYLDNFMNSVKKDD